VSAIVTIFQSYYRFRISIHSACQGFILDISERERRDETWLRALVGLILSLMKALFPFFWETRWICRVRRRTEEEAKRGLYTRARCETRNEFLTRFHVALVNTRSKNSNNRCHRVAYHITHRTIIYNSSLFLVSPLASPPAACCC
jgi:hypothetical protein